MTRSFAINEAARRTEVLEKDHFVIELGNSPDAYIVTTSIPAGRKVVATISFSREFPRLRVNP